jgi:CheY-like chemotaxis protein
MEAVPGAAVPDSHLPLPALTGKSLLIVDDHASSRRVCLQLARRWGLTAQATASRHEALEAMRQDKPLDLLLVDTRMGDTDGVTLVRELRRTPPGLAQRVVLMGALADRPEPGVCSELGLQAYINKPLRPAQMQSALVQALANTAPQPRPVMPPRAAGHTAFARRYPVRVLLAEDNLINQKVALRMLQQLGFKADVAPNGKEVLRALERQPYDLVLMDVQMPEMDGLEATRQIRLRQKNAAGSPNFGRPIVIVAMTANAMHGDREKCVAAGMDEYIPKPIRADVLQGMIERFGKLVAPVGALAAEPLAEPSASSLPAGPAPLSGGDRADGPTLLQLESAVPPRPPPAVPKPCVDMQRLDEFACGDLAAMNDLVNIYLKQTTEHLAQIEAAIRASDATTAAKVAHTCAGASFTCGMVAIAPLLKDIEHAAKAGDLARAPETLQAAHREFARIRQFFAARFQNVRAAA